MKRQVSMLIAVVLLLCCVAQGMGEGVSLNALGKTKLRVSISTSGSKVTASAIGSAANGCTVLLTLCIQEYRDGKWTAIKSLSGGSQISVSATMTSGRKYKAHAKCFVYKEGELYDTISSTSSSVSY